MTEYFFWTKFPRELLAWYDLWGRHSLVWKDRDNRLPRSQRAYYTLVSEIMLQQTQVSRVEEYFPKFIKQFPDIVTLAQADIEQVLYLWQGLGYYRRARYLHQCAQLIVARYNGSMPRTVEELQAMPGIGKSTAHAILAQTDNQRLAILDANVIRVLSRLHAITSSVSHSTTQNTLWRIAEQIVPEQSKEYTQAIMDFGALVCTGKPDCPQCFANSYCQAYQQGLVDRIPLRVITKRQKLRLFYLFVQVNGQLLLEQRNDFTIWQGMWALPEFATLTALHLFVHNHKLQFNIRDIQKIKWVLTHREVYMRSIPAGVTRTSLQVQEKNMRFVDIHRLETIALAPPFIRLLRKHRIQM